MRTTSMRTTLLIVAVLLAWAVHNLMSPWSPRTARAAIVPRGLPSHFGIGLSAGPSSNGLYGWMPNSTIPWDYAYQYLSGGVNTGSGWETWSTSGQFPLTYAQGAASHSYIPVFPYYELLQSTGTCGSCGEAQKDLSNLNNAGLMAGYFQNFRLLMQRLGPGTYTGLAGFGKTAIVHVEPDLSGYAEQAVLDNSKCYGSCTGQGNNPAYLAAAVAGSGDPEVAGYPNTYQGFNWALLHLRDLYAPNVLLAFHVSNWATGPDIGGDTSTSLDAAGLGQEAGSFAAQAGIAGVPSGTSSYDLLVNDVANRDAASSKYVYNSAHAWWDQLNVAFPTFQRWESYVAAASTAAGRAVIVWQIPRGNQYFDTENNTNGHYQDNRAEYFFGHIGELAQAGIIGLLFGSGTSGNTSHTDALNDGTTNPAPLCTSDGLSSGQICANHTSTVSDDDGGYIRMQAQQYYAGGGYQVGGGTAAATPTVPAATVPATPTVPAATVPATPTAPVATAPATPTAPAATVPATPTAPVATAPATAVAATATGTPAQATAAASNTPVVPTATASPSGTGSNSIDDTFMRADQTGWGTGTKPDGVPGVTWGMDGSGAKPSVTISSQAGSYGYPGVTNVVGIASAGSTPYTGGDALVRFSVSAVGHVTPYVVENACSDKSCYYGARLHTSRNRLEVAKRSANMTNILASVPFTAAANTVYWMRLHVTPGTSTTLQATVWADGAPEPSSWMVSTTDASPLAANRVGTGGTWDGAGTGESIRYTWFAYAASGQASPPP